MKLVTMGNPAATAEGESRQRVSDLFHQLSHPDHAVLLARVGVTPDPQRATVRRNREACTGPGRKSVIARDNHAGTV